MENITLEQVAYLNENLDAINEYVAERSRDFGWLHGEQVLHVAMYICADRNADIEFKTAHHAQLINGWKPVLEYVENAVCVYVPPILK